MNTSPLATPARQTALTGLAVVGFIAILAFGVWLAVYSARYVPRTVGALGSAAFYLGSVFTPAPGLTVVPTASTTIPFGIPDLATPTSTPAVPASAPVQKPVATKPGAETSGTYPIAGTSAAALSGLPDFSVTIDAVGYLATTSAESFVATSTVPAGSRPAVTFTIKNTGTNATGSWRFSVTIPTATGYLYQSQPQQSLNPGDSIQYTLGFDQALTGAKQSISITANFDHAITESNTGTDTASATLTILGS